jgi:hypothetical protein
MLHDEESYMQGEASAAIGGLASEYPDLCDHILPLAKLPYPVSVQKAALETLFLGWPAHPRWPEIVSQIRESASVDLRLIAIRKRVQWNAQTEEDFNELLMRASGREDSSWSHGGSIARTLVEGWPRHAELKRAALEAIQPHYWGEDGLDRKVALDILIDGYGDDDEAVTAIARLLGAEQFHFLWRERWERMLARFSGKPAIVAALDEWLAKQKPVDAWELSHAAEFGWTEIGKRKLLECVTAPAAFCFWAAKALLDHWGMADPEVAGALQHLARSPNAAEIGLLLPRILSDPEECNECLMALLRDTSCQRPDLVLQGLGKLGRKDGSAEVVAAALRFRDRGWVWEDVVNVLTHYYRHVPPVRDLALRQLAEPGGSLAIVAECYADDSELRAQLLALATPLPAKLRSIIVGFLGDHCTDFSFALDLLGQYDMDEDPEIKVQAAIQYFRNLAQTRANVEDHLARLSSTIVCYGPDHEERRQAAFCGLQLLGRLDLMLAAKETIETERPPHISLSARATPNVTLVRHILSHWEAFKAALGERFWDSISGMREDRLSLWATLAMLADEYPAPRAEALRFVREEAHSAVPGTLLDFLGRVQPKTLLLRHQCMRSLLLNAGYGRRDSERAAELLGRDFSDDLEVRELIRAELLRHYPAIGLRAVWALSEIWPESPELGEEYAAVREQHQTASDWLVRHEAEMNLICALGTPEEVVLAFRALLRQPRPRWQYVAEKVRGPILRRVSRDPELQRLLWNRLNSTSNPSEQASFALLLGAGQQYAQELRKWCLDQCDAAYTEAVAPAGTDLLTGAVRPVREVAAGLLFRDTGH